MQQKRALSLIHIFGRADQSVNESVMVKRGDQQLRVTRHMIDCQDLDQLQNTPRLRSYICLLYTSLSLAADSLIILSRL